MLIALAVILAAVCWHGIVDLQYEEPCRPLALGMQHVYQTDQPCSLVFIPVTLSHLKLQPQHWRCFKLRSIHKNMCV